MVNNYEKQSGVAKRGTTKNAPEAPKPSEPKVVTHQSYKIREKTRYDDQWGPLGW